MSYQSRLLKTVDSIIEHQKLGVSTQDTLVYLRLLKKYRGDLSRATGAELKDAASKCLGKISDAIDEAEEIYEKIRR